MNRIALKNSLHHLYGRNLPRQVMTGVVVDLLPVGARTRTVDLPALHSNCTGNRSYNSKSFPLFQFKSLATSARPPAPDANEEEKDSIARSTTATATTSREVKANTDKPWLLDLGLPSLLPEYRKMFDTSTLFTDVSAGITIGCIAVPLSLAIAIASGVPPEVGLVTAAVSGVAGSLLGGTTLAITGPAAAISLLVVGAVQQHGLEALPLITLACGGLQVVSGVTRLGVMAKLVPVSVIAGFTTGVGAMILTGQIPKALGMMPPTGLNPIETIGFIGEHLSMINPSSAALSIGTAAAMFFLPRIHPKMPSALLAVGGATMATHGLGLDVALIGNIPSGLGAFQWAMPVMPAMDAWPSLGVTIFLIYAMTSAESLLSCAALEKMKKTSYQHSPDQELIGQGLANVGAAMFMGMPVTSVIARSGLNVKLGAASRLPGLVQAGFVFGSVVCFSESIATIPMPALSGMLITTGIGMLNPAEFKHCFAIQKLDTIPFLTTIGGMIAFGLAEGIGVGCLSAWALNYDYGKLAVKEMNLPHKESSNTTDHLEFSQFELHLPQEGASTSESPTKSTIGWQLKGPLNFASMFEIDGLVHRIEELKTGEKVIHLEMKETTSVEFTGTDELVNRMVEVGEKNPGLAVSIREMKAHEKVIVLDMQETTSVEFTGVEEVVNRLVEVIEQNPGTTVQMWNCHEELLKALQQCDPSERISRFRSTDESPYHFPPKEKEVSGEQVPYWYDSPYFQPGDDSKGAK
jgi:MFS superfamily sulfate permease-like transporter